MMDLPELIVLDVGHGSSAILRDTQGTLVIDCGTGSILIETLHYLHINKELHSIIISHADEDHIGGLINLLASQTVKIQNIFLNADAMRKTRIWIQLRQVLREARKRDDVKIHVGITTLQTRSMSVGEVTIEVLAPTPEIAMSGVGGEDLHGNRLEANTMSVVVGLIHRNHRVVLLAGDVDSTGLRNILEEHENLNADVLVFPHHGGRAGNIDGERFAQIFCSAVQPKFIIFSIDRNHLVNPREEIIRGIRSVMLDTRIVCTQLSRRCAAQLPNTDYTHLNALPARGKESNNCCGGTISLILDGQNTGNMQFFTAHHAFVKGYIPTPLCLYNVAEE